LIQINYTIVRFRQVDFWRDLDLDELPDPRQVPIFRTPDCKENQRVDQLVDLPLLDDQQREINIYDDQGFRISRRKPIYRNTSLPCGLLIDLTQVRSLFQDPAALVFDMENEEMHEEEERNCDINVYPQAFLRRYGHFQADDVPLGFKKLLKGMNRNLAADPQSPNSVIHGVSCQGYNSIQHCLAQRSGGLELVHGYITAAVSGFSATDQASLKKFQKTLEVLLQALPYRRIEKKLCLEEKLERSIRLEPIFVVDVQSIKEELQNGGFVFYSCFSIDLLSIHAFI
jgi:hypothetical protein